VVITSVKFVLEKLGWARFPIFSPTGRRLRTGASYFEPEQEARPAAGAER
jgi:hypothetical protein